MLTATVSGNTLKMEARTREYVRCRTEASQIFKRLLVTVRLFASPSATSRCSVGNSAHCSLPADRRFGPWNALNAQNQDVAAARTRQRPQLLRAKSIHFKLLQPTLLPSPANLFQRLEFESCPALGRATRPRLGATPKRMGPVGSSLRPACGAIAELSASALRQPLPSRS